MLENHGFGNLQITPTPLQRCHLSPPAARHLHPPRLLPDEGGAMGTRWPRGEMMAIYHRVWLPMVNEWSMNDQLTVHEWLMNGE